MDKKMQLFLPATYVQHFQRTFKKDAGHNRQARYRPGLDRASS
jgi:hypothetical protein